MQSNYPERYVREELLPNIDHIDYLTNVRIEDMHHSRKRRGEIDLIIFTSEGILVCEIKGGHEVNIIKGRSASGKETEKWEYTVEKANGKTWSFTKNESPFEQVTQNLESFREWIINKDNSFKNVLFARACIFPFFKFDGTKSGPLNEMEISFDASISKDDFNNFVQKCFELEKSKAANRSKTYVPLDQDSVNFICKTVHPKFGTKLDCSDVRQSYLETMKKHFYGPCWESDETKTISNPRQFACGAIFPKNWMQNDDSGNEDPENEIEIEDFIEDDHGVGLNLEDHKIKKRSDPDDNFETEPDDAFSTNFPSSFGITFLLEANSKFILEYGFSEYKDSDSNPIERQQIKRRGKIHIDELNFSTKSYDGESKETKSHLANTDVEIRIRRIDSSKNSSIQIFMLNKSKSAKSGPVYYQCGLKVKVKSGKLLPAPKLSEHFETASLYSDKDSFGKGLQTSVDWSKDSIWSDFVPSFTIPRIGHSNEHTKANIKFSYLADFDKNTKDEYIKNLNGFIDDYVNHLESFNANNDDEKSNKEGALYFSKRLRNAVDVLEENDDALEAFKLMNHAFHLNFLLKNNQSDENFWKDKENLIINEPDKSPEWRSFQIAFCLASIPEMVYPDEYSAERSIVDLIWFPTGGGKTEAYNALLSFTIFYRRLENPENSGVNVLMRYTLRFLTIDQFNRLAKLITCMDLLRENKQDSLGSELISLGVWVGRNSSINKNANALKVIRRGPKDMKNANPTFLLRNCPVCNHDLFDNKAPGYVEFKYKKNYRPFCPIEGCKVKEIPVYQSEESTLEVNPTAIIATVDSFAKLSWEDRKTDAIFNKNLEGVSPPELIIQDELHLIGGPLGTLVGLYDQLVMDFCSKENPVKVIGSTATITNAIKQVKNLYGNRDLCLCPPPEKRWGDSFFMKESSNPGEDRMYVGLMSTFLNAPETSSKIKAICLHATSRIRKDVYRQSDLSKVIDPYWTILSYFNSVKELSYASSQILELSTKAVYENRYDESIPGPPDNYDFLRKSRNYDEITGRKTQTELNETRKRLRDEYDDSKEWQDALDLVLATNMISVGVDVPRLGLMIINGFPKLTSEYIQASSRVGRTYPGLIFTSYRSTKKRDLSHYENFKSIHQSIYKMVEPVSVSPFSSGARAKGFIGLLTARLLYNNYKVQPSDYSDDEIQKECDWIIDKVKKLYPNDQNTIQACINELVEIKNKWLNDKPKFWGGMMVATDKEKYLCAPYTGVDDPRLSFDMLTSLRNVGRELTVFKNSNKRIEYGRS